MVNRPSFEKSWHTENCCHPCFSDVHWAWGLQPRVCHDATLDKRRFCNKKNYSEAHDGFPPKSHGLYRESWIPIISGLSLGSDDSPMLTCYVNKRTWGNEKWTVWRGISDWGIPLLLRYLKDIYDSMTYVFTCKSSVNLYVFISPYSIYWYPRAG